MKCIGSDIRQKLQAISSSTSEDVLTLTENAFKRMQTEKHTWYASSKHLRPIASDIQRIVKADRQL
jgi:3-deoxy-D-arabino-heptulosonate 7-phosphate (DAHP) synthase class II